MYKCTEPGCSAEYDKPQGLGAHRRSHLTKEEQAEIAAKRARTMNAKKDKKASVDDIFERVEAATKILFPDPNVFYERFEEVAELRHAMLQVLKR